MSIFEPRYRQLYDDILLSGARRFVVVAHDPETDRLSEVGAVLYLDNLNVVSELTDDRVKFVGEHEVIGRVRIQRVLNAAAWFDRSTYLRADTVPYEDDLDASARGDAEAERESAGVLKDLESLALIQQTFDEGIFELTPDLASAPAKSWALASHWSQYLALRVLRRQRPLEADVAQMLFSHATSNGDGIAGEPPSVQRMGVPPSLQAKLQVLIRAGQEEVIALTTDRLEFECLALQSNSDCARFELLRENIRGEHRRLATLQTMHLAVHGPEDQN